MKAKIITLITVCICSFIFTGCNTTFSNLTSQRVPQNPSGIYTISLAANIGEVNYINDTLRAWIVIDGKKIEMKPSAPGSRVFEYDYAMEATRNSAIYYFEAVYKVYSNGVPEDRDYVSETHTMSLTNRYIVSMQATRGPVGAMIPVVGRGFNRFDRIAFNGVEVDTQFSSSVALSFIVPPMPANEDYNVTLVTGTGDIPIGSFRIDTSQIHISPATLLFDKGESKIVLFSIPRPASTGGLKIEVTTNIPRSIIMPAVVIPEGSKTINIRVQAGEVGSGLLFVSAPGFENLEVPVAVRDVKIP